MSQYNISNKVLKGALTDSLDVLQLFSGKVVVRTRLHLELSTLQGPQIQDLSGNMDTYNSLEFLLPEGSEYLDVPLYSLLLSETQNVEPEVFLSTLNTVVNQLVKLDDHATDNEPKQVPGLLLKLLEAMSVMNVQQIKQTIPEFLTKSVREMTPREEVFR